ncbi:TetR/AcrR family transcriptional regulator [Tissierella creatinini]|nr:TetR/AcrR family transcriptional regulator [Tissierella creatinini]TJX59987.1 TetR/AcrR family transcriptional regulator [Soehngenia saccharolytica]
MNREEKNLLKRQQIIRSAMEEFGENTYGEASLNAICKNGNVSKGIIYHYFKDKDDLYLSCVAECFHRLTTFLNSQILSFNNVEDDIKKYIDMRHRFFNENPDCSNIFFYALLQPPKHLVEEIKEIKAELDRFNIGFYQQVLQNVKLKSDISREEAIEFFLMFQESFNHYFQDKTYGDSRKLFDEHELKLSKLLKIIFYGIAREETK